VEWIIIVALLAIAVGIGLLARSRLVLAGCPIGGRVVLGALAGRAR
jgi:hypothetical protein